MAGLQTIIDKCNGLEIDRRKVVGIQYTRNEIPRTSFTPTKNPWRMSLDMPPRLKYSENRDLIEALDTLDRITPQVISFANNSKLSWIFAYQGEMNPSQISALSIQSFIGDQLVLINPPALSSSAVLFKPNDLIQIGNFYFPFTSTTQVLRGTGSTITITTNRPNILTNSVVGYGLTVGNACKFTMFCPNMPTYKLIVGGTILTNGVITNNALLEWQDSFDLYEYVGQA